MELQSSNIGELCAALVKVQGTIGKASKSAANPFFKSKYADLNEMIDVSREVLPENGLSVVQNATLVDGTPTLVCTIMHVSGQWIRGFYELKPAKQNDPQAMGSCITYMRRYSLAAMLGIAQEDDDANYASKKPEQQKPKQNLQNVESTPKFEELESASKPEAKAATLTQERVDAMSKELEKLGYPKRNEQLILASSVLEKPVKDLLHLTDTEAFEVWSYAKKVAKANVA